MASPLSPAPAATLNSGTPTTARRYDKYEVHTFTSTETHEKTEDNRSSTSSPFVSCLNDSPRNAGKDTMSPAKSARHSRVLSGAELSPLKMLAGQKRSSPDGGSANDENTRPSFRSPRKQFSPEKRFPVKISTPSREETPTKDRKISLEQALEDNEGLRHAIDIFEDESVMDEDASNVDPEMVAPSIVHQTGDDEMAGPDDTMMSTFSTFSAVPNLTMLARMGHSPLKASHAGNVATPRARADPTPARTPREDTVKKSSSGNTTDLLMDFTDQIRAYSQTSPSRRGNLPHARTTPTMGSTPSGNRTLANLIDFDIPPMPTPRSVPTVTPRELESLKSSFLSEISSLKASLSGKEAEVQSLKTAVGDAEKRVGESMEQVREERGVREQLAAEKEDWEKRGREMEGVLRKIKEEIVLGQREREELECKLDESEKRRDAAEMMHQEAESKMAGMRAGKDAERSSPQSSKSPGDSNKEVELAVERVARDLHALYKSKHETKVAALKKSYESRWEKKVRELETKVEDLNEDNERLRNGRDTTLTRVDPNSAEAQERKAQAVKDSAAIKELNADVQRLEAVVGTIQLDNDSLRVMLERERVEKGELVQLAEEMMGMQSFVGGSSATSSQARQNDALKTPRAAATTAETLRNSISRSSGLRAPAPASGLRAPHERTKSGGGGLPRPGGPRSGIMSSIEKMGSYRGRAAE